MVKTFSSKLMLFGEYSVLYGSSALAIPFSEFLGRLKFDKNPNSIVLANQKKLGAFLQFLKGKNISFLDILRLEEDLLNGLYFESTIPQNYGLGSSGALVASVFEEYNLLPEFTTNRLGELKTYLAQLESFYHGNSSGIDPLVSFLNKSVLIADNKPPKIVGLSDLSYDESVGIFLINTQIHSSTSDVMNYFQQQYKNTFFRRLFENVYIPSNNKSVSSFLNNREVFFEELEILIRFQLQNLTGMIPKNWDVIIEDGLKNKNWYLKILGSGGGGFLLGFTKNIVLTKELFAQNNINIIPVRLVD